MFDILGVEFDTMSSTTLSIMVCLLVSLVLSVLENLETFHKYNDEIISGLDEYCQDNFSQSAYSYIQSNLTSTARIGVSKSLLTTLSGCM